MSNLFAKDLIYDDDGGAKVTTKYEAIITNGTIKIFNGAVANGTDTLYTVPAGSVFYLTAATICVTSHSADGTWERGKLIIAGNDAMQTATPKQWTTITNSASFSIPIKLIAGQTLQVYSLDSTCTTGASFYGYEVVI